MDTESVPRGRADSLYISGPAHLPDRAVLGDGLQMLQVADARAPRRRARRRTEPLSRRALSRSFRTEAPRPPAPRNGMILFAPVQAGPLSAGPGRPARCRPARLAARQPSSPCRRAWRRARPLGGCRHVPVPRVTPFSREQAAAASQLISGPSETGATPKGASASRTGAAVILAPFGTRAFSSETANCSPPTICGQRRLGKVDLSDPGQTDGTAFLRLSPMASLRSLPDRVKASAVWASGSEHCDGMVN
jgi:hypothetical protein